MNCVKCPIIEDCKVSRICTQSIAAIGVFIPTEAKPVDPNACPLLRLIKESGSE